MRFLSIVFSLLCPLYAQVERTSLAGTVTDNTTAVLPNVAIKVTNQDTNTAINLLTEAAGDYRAVNLTPGSYTVEAVKQGRRSNRTILGVDRLPCWAHPILWQLPRRLGDLILPETEFHLTWQDYSKLAISIWRA